MLDWSVSVSLCLSALELQIALIAVYKTGQFCLLSEKNRVEIRFVNLHYRAAQLSEVYIYRAYSVK